MYLYRPERKLNRLKEYNYSSNGYYFFTISCRGAINRVSTIMNNGGITGNHNPMSKNSLGSIIRCFKAKSAFEIHNFFDVNFSWHRNYHDHIIRNEKSLQNIQNYIIHNPWKWESDRNNPKNLKFIT